MRGRLSALPGETRAALQRAASIGSTLDAATLAIASERDLAPALRPAIEQHLLLESVRADRRTYQFPHDRVHEAAYALVRDHYQWSEIYESLDAVYAQLPSPQPGSTAMRPYNQSERGRG